MKVVADSNRIIASLLKSGTTREILFNGNFDFVAPEFIKEEISKYKLDLIKKAKITAEEFDVLLSLFFERIKLIPKNEYRRYTEELKSKISDTKDIPYIACCLAAKAEGIWSHDPHFLKQDKAKIFTNKDLLDMSRS